MTQGCPEFRRSLMSRRSLLHAGVGALGLGSLLRNAKAATKGGREPSVILLWMRGGPSHIDMWDPKPDAPVEFRGEFGSKPTKVPGITITDRLPLSARVMDKWSIVRSLHHADAGHSTGDQICFTGYPSGPNADQNIHPSCGSIVSRQLGHKTPHLPAYVMIPKMLPGAGSAYLGVAHKPFETLADPAANGPFRVPNFDLATGLDAGKLQDRRSLLGAFDKMRRDADTTGQLDALDRYGRKAWDILTSNAARDAFDLDKETAKTRERYGFIPAWDPGSPDRCGAPAWSQRILLARRLVEAGVRLVTVDVRWWDTHVKGFESLKFGFLPRWDQAYSALIEDLEARGLLESTLVVAWGEFGRTPRVNAQAGRDHYPNVFSAALAGGPVKGGRVIGASDANGAFPKTDPRKPQDVLATMYHHLGIDTEVSYMNNARPIPVLPFGKSLEF